MENRKKIFELEKKLYGITYDESIQVLREKYKSTDILEVLGYLVCGPMYVGFCEQAVRIAKEEEINLILPIMREGMLYKQILDILLEEDTISVLPIWVSRRTAYLCMPESEFNYQFFKEICMLYPKKIGTAFTRLGLEEYSYLYEKNEKEINAELAHKKDDWLLKLYDTISENGLSQIVINRINGSREGLNAYLESVGINCAFVTLDIGSLGTIPRAIDNCTADNIKKIHLYLKIAKNAYIPQNHDIRYIFYDGVVDEREYNILSNVFSHFWEIITMGDIDKGTAIGYRVQDGKVDVICEEKSIDKYTFDCIRKIKKGIIEFTRDYARVRNNKVVDTYKMLLDGVGSLCRIIEYPQKIEAELLGAIIVNESALKQNFRMIANANCVVGSEDWKTEKSWDIYSSAFWVQGGKVLRDSNIENNTGIYCAVFGAGQDGIRAVEWILNQGGRVECIIDNYKCGKVYDGIPIVSIDALEECKAEDILIASTRFEKELEEQLLKYLNEHGKTYNIHYIKR